MKDFVSYFADSLGIKKSKELTAALDSCFNIKKRLNKANLSTIAKELEKELEDCASGKELS